MHTPHPPAPPNRPAASVHAPSRRRRVALAIGLSLLGPSAATATATAAPPPPAASAPAPRPAQPAPTATPSAAPAPAAPPTPAPAPARPDQAALRAEYETLRDELFRARARLDAVTRGVLATRLRVTFQWKGGRRFVAQHLVAKLDGAPLAELQPQEGRQQVFVGVVAPGRHTVSVRLDVVAKGDGAFAYSTEQAFGVVAPDQREVELALTADEDGYVGDWAKAGEAAYRPSWQAELKASEAREAKR